MNPRRITSLDRTETSLCSYARPSRRDDLTPHGESPVIARGAGLSYCNAATIAGGTCIDMRNFDRVIEFDEVGGLITVEAGIAIGQLNNLLISRGWYLPVLPGYPMITVGGCVAFNVHGKAQYKVGTFMDWVDELEIFHPSNGIVSCSRNVQPELFELTLGGMGLTGIITQVRLKLARIEGDSLQIRRVPVASLSDAVRVLREQADSTDYAYSWNNLNLRGKSFGKGLVYLEDHLSGRVGKPGIQYRDRLPRSQRFFFAHTRFTVSWMCRMYAFLEHCKPAQRKLSLSAATFPIYGKEIYYYLFGKNGFREYQVLFPTPTWEAAAADIERQISNLRVPIALGSLKLFRGKTHNLSFSGEGVCLAIDVPNDAGSRKFFDQLDEITLERGGIINLSKDSRADRHLVSRTFQSYAAFRSKVSALDPRRAFVSDLGNRIGI